MARYHHKCFTEPKWAFLCLSTTLKRVYETSKRINVWTSALSWSTDFDGEVKGRKVHTEASQSSNSPVCAFHSLSLPAHLSSRLYTWTFLCSWLIGELTCTILCFVLILGKTKTKLFFFGFAMVFWPVKTKSFGFCFDKAKTKSCRSVGETLCKNVPLLLFKHLRWYSKCTFESVRTSPQSRLLSCTLYICFKTGI